MRRLFFPSSFLPEFIISDWKESCPPLVRELALDFPESNLFFLPLFFGLVAIQFGEDLFSLSHRENLFLSSFISFGTLSAKNPSHYREVIGKYHHHSSNHQPFRTGSNNHQPQSAHIQESPPTFDPQPIIHLYPRQNLPTSRVRTQQVDLSPNHLHTSVGQAKNRTQSVTLIYTGSLLRV